MPDDDPFAVVVLFRTSEVFLEHGGAGLLRLEHQRVAVVPAEKEIIQARVPTLPTPTAVKRGGVARIG